MQEWLIFCLKRKWCWKGNNIFTISRDFQRIRWTHHFSTIFNWIAPEHYVTLQLKNHNSSTFIHLISFVLFVRSLQDGQNHLLAPINSSGSKIFFMDSGTHEVKGRVIISNFCSWMLQQKQTLQMTGLWRVDEMILSASWGMPSIASITICKISGTSF